MASHGIPRVQSSGPKSQQAREKELHKIGEYSSLVERVCSAIQQQDFTDATLDLTSELLMLNPEYYTIWNYRRRILQHIFGALSLISTDAESSIKSRLTSDLLFLLPLLIKFPKCYWIWNHRLWILRQHAELLPPHIAQEAWQQELGLVGKMLTRDNRNFHGWGYRRMVVTELQAFEARDKAGTKSAITQPSMLESELAYTKRMIDSNLSNFSAWHNRSKIIPHVLSQRNANLEQRRKLFDDELVFLKSALFVDPYDQSLWFYHQYLMSVILANSETDAWSLKLTNHDRTKYLEQEILEIREVLLDTDDCKWVYQYLLQYTASSLAIGGGNAFVSTQEMSSWLAKLRMLDPLREQRWNDLEKGLNL